MNTNNTAANEQQNASVETFSSAAIFNGALAISMFIAFELVRKRNKKIYEPRTYLLPESKRTPAASSGFLRWIVSTNSLTDDQIIRRIGLDSYMFIRFQRLFMIVFAIFSVLGIAVILPINYFNYHEQSSPGVLEKFTIGNIGNENSNKLWAHALMSYVFTGIVVYMSHRELNHYIRLRHEFLSSPGHRTSPKATTILVTGIPNELNNEKSLRSLFGIFPGGVKNIWINRDPGKLIKKTNERKKLVTKYEGAATQLIINHSKQHEKKTDNTNDDNTNGDNTNDDNTEKIRPVHRKIPVVGKKVDSLTTYHTKLLDLNQSINDLQKNPVTFKKLNSAFIQFNNYIGAQLAATSIRPKNLNDIAAKDVIWDNLNYTKKQLMIKKIVSILAASALALLWFLPVTFLALISKYENLTKILPFLKSGVLPQSITGPIQGIIPPVGLAILMTILPVILRILSKFEGIVTHSRVEISVQRKYFFFLVVNVLLVTALANGVLSALPLILNVGDTVNVLAAKLPAVSTFFLTYVFLSLSGSAMELLQIVPLIVYLISKRFLAKTPRNIYHLEKDMKYVEWGTRFPTHVLMASIGIVYSTIQPLILPLVFLHFTFYHFAYKYNFLYVYKQPNKSGGLLFPPSIYQVFVGLYISQLTMIGLMSLTTAFYPVILMIILFIITIAALFWMKQIFNVNPRAEFLPADFKGTVDVNTGKLIINQTVNESGSGFGGTHAPIGTKELSTDNGEDDEDDYCNQDFDGLDVVNLDVGGKISTIYLHPAIKSIQPAIWLPKDDNGTSDKEVSDCLNDGIDATNQGASINDKHKVVVNDFSRIPRGSQVDTDGSVANNIALVL
ncbi:2976_t:CDS:2 [Entrophospora sp. SA101]|nr:2976_t:CDS:2 [Entrophospora sp. SA101]CAJ0826981.1 9656_t:CDS:2 [Entrophospora sp. SA101]